MGQSSGSPAAAVADGAAAESLGATILRQTTHFAALRTLTSLSTLLTYIVLGRLLDRHAIGVYEIGQFYIGFGFLLGEGGLSAALIRSRADVRDHDYRVVLTSVLGLGLLMAVIYFSCTRWIARANHMSDVDLWVLRALTPLLLLQALPVVPLTKLRRDNRYDQVGWIQLVSTLGRHGAALIGAFSFGGSAALAAAALVQACTKVWIAYRAAPGWVGLAFRWGTLRTLLPYGSKVQIGTILQYLRENIAAALLGPALGPEPVAIFRQAASYAKVPADSIGGLARVQFRLYAVCDRGSPALSQAIVTALRASFLLGSIMLGPLAALAVWLIPDIYGQKWLPAVPLVWGLIPHVMCDIAMQQIFVVAQGQGRAGTAAAFYGTWSIATWATFGASLLLGGNQLFWVAVGQSVGSTLALAAALIWVARYAGLAALRGLIQPLAALIVAVLAALLVNQRLVTATPALRGVGGAVTFLIAFVGVALLLDRSAIIADARSAVRALRRRR